MFREFWLLISCIDSCYILIFLLAGKINIIRLYRKSRCTRTKSCGKRQDLAYKVHNCAESKALVLEWLCIGRNEVHVHVRGVSMIVIDTFVLLYQYLHSQN